MRNGQCPKCGHDDIRLADNSGNERRRIADYFSSGVRIDTLVCLHCRYIEEYVSADDAKKLAKTADSWPRVDKNHPLP